MEALKYRDFVWPQNPHTYREVVTREPVYQTVDGVASYSGMGPMCRVITGSGVFCGSGAYGSFKNLLKEAESAGAGYLIHPVWGERNCYFTRLELNQQPREDYVSYSFEFTQCSADGTVPK